MADMEIDKVADMVADMEVDKVFSSRRFCGPKPFQAKAFLGLRIFKLCKFFFFSAQQQQYHQKWDRYLC